MDLPTEILSMNIELNESIAYENLRVANEEYLEDEDYEEAEFVDDDYEPGTKKQATSRGRTTRSKSKAQNVDSKRKEKTLKKDIELPIKIDLIALVKAQPSLYNLKDPMYMTRNHKEKIWSEIADTMMEKYPDMNVEKCKKMWNAVRESTR